MTARYEYDDEHQAWTCDGRYLRCGHPEAMPCDCYGRAHAGEPVPTVSGVRVVFDYLAYRRGLTDPRD